MQTCLVALFAVGIGLFIGVILFIYPFGPLGKLHQKTAASRLRSPWTRAVLAEKVWFYPFDRLKYTEAMAKDPVAASFKYTPWAVSLYRVMGVVWIVTAAGVFLRLTPMCWPRLQAFLR